MTTHSRPVPFTAGDYAARMARVVGEALGTGLDGVIVAPGPDLVWLTGYQPTAITERLTMLILSGGLRPTLFVPTLERPDAEAAVGAAGLWFVDWADAEIVRLSFAGRRENEVAADLVRMLRDFGHEQVDFTVVGSGSNGANPHHEAGDRVIEPGDAVVLDFGGLMYGYGSDTTRTVSVGDPRPEVRRVHDIVRTAQQAAFEAVRPGVPCEEIDRAARPSSPRPDTASGGQRLNNTGRDLRVVE